MALAMNTKEAAMNLDPPAPVRKATKKRKRRTNKGPPVDFRRKLVRPNPYHVSELRQPSEHKTLVPQERSYPDVPVQCHAHTAQGRRCTKVLYPWRNIPSDCDRPIPLCPKCIRNGDAAVMVAKHPIVGNTLVARFNLPKNYALYYFGLRERESDVVDGPTGDWVYDFKSHWVMDPVKLKEDKRYKLNCQLRFANSPGKGETHNLRPTEEEFGRHDSTVVGAEFRTTLPIPAGTQILWEYDGDGWFTCRDIKRRNMGTKDLPAPKKGEYRRYNERRRLQELRAKWHKKRHGRKSKPENMDES